jgi:hypothetical protein
MGMVRLLDLQPLAAFVLRAAMATLIFLLVIRLILQVLPSFRCCTKCASHTLNLLKQELCS